MDTFEVEQRETLTRDEAATRLRRIANAGFCELIRGQVGAWPRSGRG
jgi:hypothetical protein